MTEERPSNRPYEMKVPSKSDVTEKGMDIVIQNPAGGSGTISTGTQGNVVDPDTGSSE